MKKTIEKKEQVVITEEMYETLRHPVITEKAMKGAEQGQVTFYVPLVATKPDIKKAVEALFGVKVKAVNTLRTSGKSKIFRGMKGKRSDLKKAIVSLENGQHIDVTTGI